MSWSEKLLEGVKPRESEGGPVVLPRLSPSDRVTRYLKPLVSAPPLRRMNGFGVGLYGWLRHPAIVTGYVKLYFVTALWIPILPICAYVVESDGNSFRFYRRLSLIGVIRAFGWRVIPFYITALFEGLVWLVLCGALILSIVGGLHWLRGQF